MNIGRISDIHGYNHSCILQLHGMQLGFTKCRRGTWPRFTVIIRCYLNVIERKIAQTPVPAPAVNNGREQGAVLHAATHIRFTLIPHGPFDGVWDQRRNHGIVEHRRCIRAYFYICGGHGVVTFAAFPEKVKTPPREHSNGSVSPVTTEANQTLVIFSEFRCIAAVNSAATAQIDHPDRHTISPLLQRARGHRIVSHDLPVAILLNPAYSYAVQVGNVDIVDRAQV